MSIIDRDYLEKPKPVEIPRELAVLIVRKAVAMAEAFENQAIDQMTREARRALQRGAAPAVIVRQMEL